MQREPVVTPTERGNRGRKRLRLPGANSCAPLGQDIAPELSVDNTLNEPVFPVGTIFEEDGVLSDEHVAMKLLGIEADHAFLAALDRAAQAGRQFSHADAERLYERLEAIHGRDSHSQGDPIGGRAYRLLETDFSREQVS